MTFASLSVFDQSGSAFLGIYVAGFFLALACSVWRRFHANAKFSLPRAAETQLTDPYEIAFLAGGAPRCAQVAVVKLITCGAVEWKRARILRESRLVANGTVEAGFNDVERTLFSAILGHGKGGMPMTKVPALVATRLSAIEARLAKLGLRPTPSETGSRGCFIMLPMLALMVFGGVKVFIGLTRDKPVIFLVILIVITFVVAVIVAANKRKLTPAGEELLARLRAGEGAQGDVLCSVAIFGAGWRGDPSLAGLDTALRKDISNMGKTSNSSGCGGGMGCGVSSGCSSGCSGGGGGGVRRMWWRRLSRLSPLFGSCLGWK